MQNLDGKVVLITGASSGIGEATARTLAKAGATVVLGARRTERLEKLTQEIEAAGGKALAKAVDVTNQLEVAAFAEEARTRFGKIDVIVNNAGVMPLSPLAALKIDEWNQMIDVNIRGVLHGIAAALPVMQAQGGGQVINIASTAGHRVWPSASVYCATKHAVLAISEGLRQEHDNLRVTVVSPGVTTSELAETTSDAGIKAWLEDFRQVAIPAEAIARAIAYAVEQPDDVDVSEIIVRPAASPN